MTISATASPVLVSGAEELAAATPIVAGEVKVYPVAKRPGITLMCISFGEGAVLPEHIAKGPILIQTITGAVKVDVEGREVDLGLGGVLHLDAVVEHAVRAPVRSRVLLTLLEPSGGTPEVPGILRKAADSAPEEPASGGGPDLIPVQDVSGQNSHGHEGGCDCGEVDEGLPELDVREIPHAIRHATVFGALRGLQAGSGMVLVAHHNPLPLLRQIEQLFDGAIEVAYLEEGPEVWKLRMLRTR